MNSLSLTTLLVLSHGARVTSGFRSCSHLATAVRVTSNRIPNIVRTSLAPQEFSHLEKLWLPSRVISNAQSGESLRHIEIEVDDATATQYRQPGQYVKARNINGKPVFLAIASPPDSRRTLSFLVKESPNHQFLLDLAPGALIDLSAPLGKGFQTEEVLESLAMHTSNSHILLMACGSGLAPIAAAIDSGCLQWGAKGAQFDSAGTVAGTGMSPRSVLLYIGARSRAHLPFAEKYCDWEKKGVQVVPVFSRTEGRYVQEALRADSLANPENTVALLCGMKGMTDAAREQLLEAGVPEHHILLNY